MYNNKCGTFRIIDVGRVYNIGSSRFAVYIHHNVAHNIILYL